MDSQPLTLVDWLWIAGIVLLTYAICGWVLAGIKAGFLRFIRLAIWLWYHTYGIRQ